MYVLSMNTKFCSFSLNSRQRCYRGKFIPRILFFWIFSATFYFYFFSKNRLLAVLENRSRMKNHILRPPNEKTWTLWREEAHCWFQKKDLTRLQPETTVQVESYNSRMRIFELFDAFEAKRSWFSWKTARFDKTGYLGFPNFFSENFRSPRKLVKLYTSIAFWWSWSKKPIWQFFCKFWIILRH